MPISRPTLWGAGSTPIRSETSATASRGEIDLRAEFDQLIFGDANHIQHGHLFLVRHMRRDADGNPTRCTCVSEELTTINADPDCSYCGGEGFLWDEQWYMGYSTFGGADSGLLRRQMWMPPGAIRTDYKIFYLRYDVPILYGDKIVEVRLDSEGDPLLPYVREAIYKPQTIHKLRSDHGRIEYITVYCREDDAIKPDNPQS